LKSLEIVNSLQKQDEEREKLRDVGEIEKLEEKLEGALEDLRRRKEELRNNAA
jgi:hypothetical protein